MTDKHIALSVLSDLHRKHLVRHPFDKELAARWMKNFIKVFDSTKLYFYQSDVDEFNRYQDQMFEKINKGDVSFAYFVNERFLQRVDERAKMIDELLAQPQDFTVDEEMSTDREKLPFPKDAQEARERWRKRIKCDLLLLKTDKDKNKKEGQEAVDKLTKRYHSFAKRMHQTDADELLEFYLTALCTSFDPHTDYMSPVSYEDFLIQMKLELMGVGATLQSEDGYTVIKHLVPGGAADKDGRLKIDDRITGVGEGENGPIVDVVDMKLKEVVKLIRGNPGTTVRLEVISQGEGMKTIKIVREKIELADSEAKGEIFKAGKQADGSPYKIGVIDLPSFYLDMDALRLGNPNYKSATRDVKIILDDFKKKGVDAVVLDLRRNGGGSLTEAITLTGLFIKDGSVVQVKDFNGYIQQHANDNKWGMVWGGPLVVLTSKFSASASEILAGAIQDYGRGLIVGDHSTHGKGTVQTLMDLGQELFANLPNSPPMGALKITIQQFYRPSGASTQKRGVLADVEIPSLTSHLDVGEADLDYSLEFDQIDPASVKKFNYVTAPLCDQLKRLSEQRVTGSEKFGKVLRNIARYQEQKAKKSITLNEEKFLKEVFADKEEENALGDLIDPNKKEIVRDFYLDEVLDICADYANCLHAAPNIDNQAQSP